MYKVTLDIRHKKRGLLLLEFIVNSKTDHRPALIEHIMSKYDLSGVKILAVYVEKIEKDEAIWIPEYLDEMLVLHKKVT